MEGCGLIKLLNTKKRYTAIWSMFLEAMSSTVQSKHET